MNWKVDIILVNSPNIVTVRGLGYKAVILD